MQTSQTRAAAAIDIGTTTIQAQLVDLDTGQTLDTFSALNDQRVFGADVISRISAAQNGKLDDLFAAINKQVKNILMSFAQKLNLSRIEKCAVSGNTTMLHIFCRTDPSAMGAAPYTPVFLKELHFSGEELSLPAENITLLPGISAFVGADITAGLVFVDIMGKGEDALFVDLGTNGEIAVWKNSEKKLFCCSTAAGPCFEEADFCISTTATRGFTASDFIDAVAEMKRQGVIDETGALAENFSWTGFSLPDGKVITQKDVRLFQLAKSAIYSGIKTICRAAGIELKNIGTAYIAGGLGFSLNPQNAAAVGLLPKEFADNSAAVKTVICGNTSLQGTVESLKETSFLPRCYALISCSETVDLANDKYFAAAFEHNMQF
ncbi:ASKHA domain-containing protein [Treponema sp. R80B11-R83G3]